VDVKTLCWLKNFAACPFNDNQRTALVFLREVGALDALSYRQLTGCAPKRVTKDLSAIKAEGLMLRRGKSRGTYYIPTEKLLKDVMSQAQAADGDGQGVMSHAQGVMSHAQGVMSHAQDKNATTLPQELIDELTKLKGRESVKVLSGLIVSLCSCGPMTKGKLQYHLKRGKKTIDRVIKPLLGKQIDYLYPMMVRHPNQAYVAKGTKMT
jgi:ATP-dependent DNA helicase RecG